MSQPDDYNLPLHRQGSLFTPVTQAASLPPRLRKFSMNAGISPPSQSTLSFSPTGEHEDDIVSLASTAEQGLNGEFESALNSRPENATASDGLVESGSGPVPPSYRQLASSSPGGQIPPLQDPHYHNDVLQIRLLGARGRRVSGERSSAVRRRPPVRGASSSSGFTGWSLLLSTSTVFRSLWRQLKRVGGLVLRGFAKDT